MSGLAPALRRERASAHKAESAAESGPAVIGTSRSRAIPLWAQAAPPVGVLARKAGGGCGCGCSGTCGAGAVEDVLSEPGTPLDSLQRATLEPAFGQSLGGVRVHHGPKAAAAARSVDAAAFTLGRDIVFGDSYRPGAPGADSLVAHEVAHTVQQPAVPGREVLAGGVRISHPHDAGERQADAAARAAVSGGAAPSLSATAPHVARQQAAPAQTPAPTPAPARPPTPAALPDPARVNTARGPNPASCLPSCTTLVAGPFLATEADVRARGQRWVDDSLACISGGAAASRAGHHAEIVANERTEYQARWDALFREYQAAAAGRPDAARTELVAKLGAECERKRREVSVEFGFNVVFEHSSGPEWGAAPGEWDTIESALDALPDEAVWGNPILLRFRREGCHPGDLNASGQCVGSAAAGGGVGFVGGETGAVGADVTMSIFNAGVGQSPYSRSASLQLPSTAQTLPHELGHVIQAQVSFRDFFDNVVQWRQYSWAWVSTQGSPHATWQAERERLRRELGVSDADLQTFLNSLQNGVPVTRGGRRYTRNGSYLNSVVPANIPSGVEFEYARTNKGDYISEIYTFAALRPAWLHSVLPAAQIEWLKRNLFRTPTTDAGLLAERPALAHRDADRIHAAYVAQGRLLFSRRQLDRLWNQLVDESAVRPESGRAIG